MKKIYIVACSLVVFTALQACKNEPKAKPEETMEVKGETPEVSTQSSALQQRQQEFGKTANDTIKQIYKEGLDAVANSGILESAKQVGDKAPEFTLKNAVGEEVSLQEYLKQGPVVLVWYRGGWCPYCNINLHFLQEELPKFKAEGANLIALTPELPDESIKTSEKHDLQFEVLSDVGNQVAKEYGVVFKLTDDVASIYNKNFGLNEHNGDSSNELPLAATYVINTNGDIVYAFLDADYRKRAEPSEITEFLKTL